MLLHFDLQSKCKWKDSPVTYSDRLFSHFDLFPLQINWSIPCIYIKKEINCQLIIKRYQKRRFWHTISASFTASKLVTYISQNISVLAPTTKVKIWLIKYNLCSRYWKHFISIYRYYLLLQESQIWLICTQGTMPLLSLLLILL